MPVAFLSSVFGPLRLNCEQHQKLMNVYIPWAINCASNSKFFLNIYFEKIFDAPLEDLRKDLGIFPPSEM